MAAAEATEPIEKIANNQNVQVPVNATIPSGDQSVWADVSPLLRLASQVWVEASAMVAQMLSDDPLTFQTANYFLLLTNKLKEKGHAESSTVSASVALAHCGLM